MPAIGFVVVVLVVTPGVVIAPGVVGAEGVPATLAVLLMLGALSVCLEIFSMLAPTAVLLGAC